MNQFFKKSLAVEAAHVVNLFCSLHITSTYLYSLAYCYGPSMLPTINLYGDLFLAEKISSRTGKVGTGDIVLIRSPLNPRAVVTKRVKGVEGDSVTYVIDPKNSDETNTVVIPKGHIWIEGDNIYNSRDSRDFGAVPYGLLCGRIFWRVWPPKRFGPLE
ncbi:mitochondrial ATP-independent inner membrane protease subunit 1b-like isoform X2 [Euphorbia lathyris]|uniref:mitochondrial ATP-independent inner membrane protease subunit 1b-like isoform X2 n=1 Tax=Euphorbia lathyris TaxID=212925 RepID=UPI00331385B8